MSHHHVKHISPRSLLSVLAQIHAPHNILYTYVVSLPFVVLKFLPCIKTDSARGTREVLKGCHGIVDALKVNGTTAMKNKCLQCTSIKVTSICSDAV